ncbi:MAG: hypothetical protein SAK29_37490 [Scytonema sp. PMC 1069.18]|nr:hypothetical protein [Scytonema sp. PMC 1069.18]MEC4883721.1 hypothetical protein [Scytonema sp. PMC 1070.18]
MTKKQRTFISIEIDPEKKTAFMEKLKQENKTATEVVLEFVDTYLSVKKQETADMEEFRRRLETLERVVGIENARLVGESTA